MKLLASLTLVSAFVLLLPAAAAAQKNNPELNQLRQKVQKLEKDVHERDHKINELKNQANAPRPADPRIHDLERRLHERDAEVNKLHIDLIHKTGASQVHSELFTFQSTIDSGKAGKMIGDANHRLSKIDGVRGVYIGRPQAKSDQDYDYAMVVILDAGTPLDRLTNNEAYKSLQTNYEKSRAYHFRK